MSFLSRLFKREEAKQPVDASETKQMEQPSLTEIDRRYVNRGLTDIPTDEEKELVSVIAASIMAGNQPDSEFKIKRILKINQERERAVAITAAIMTNDLPTSQFRLVKIEEVEKQ